MKNFNISSLSELSILLKKAFHALPSEEEFIAEGFDNELDEYRELSKGGKKCLAEMCEQEKQKTGVNSLKVKYNRVFGYFFEVPKAQASLLPEYFIRRQTLTNAERFITPELKTFEEKILNAQTLFQDRQSFLMNEIKEQVLKFSSSVQSLSKHIAQADVVQSFAQLAEKKNLSRPILLSNSHAIEIEDGRHLVVEQNLEKKGDRFIPNDLSMNEKNSFHLITGPNMAGKSTFLRQNALIMYLAHIGSFVPAKKSKIPICDSIFTRIGSGDSLSTGESTFLIEMQEASKILRHATSKSFVILDEIGRGTSTYDGLSIAWAIMEYLHEKGVKTLFATHYHELIDLAGKLKKAKNFSARVLEDERKGVIFLHQIFEGGAEKSFGIEVAKLAGLPASVIKKAEQILLQLEQQNSTTQSSQSSLFETSYFSQQSPPQTIEKKSQQEKELESLDLNNLTPLEAMMILAKWKKL